MAVEIQLDEITRSAFEADVHGIRYLQAGVARGIDETDPAKLLAKIPNLSGLDPLGNTIRVPQIGTAHKVYPQCMVTGYRVTGFSSFEAQFYVVYESPSGYGLNFIIGQWYPFRNNSISEIETWMDYKNTPITVRYKPPGAAAQTIRAGSTRKRIGYTDLMLTGVFFQDVTPAQEAAVGSVNDQIWYRGKRATWLCTGCNSRPEIFGYSWRLTATFSKNPLTWDGFERFIDPNTGQPPTDIDPADVDALVKLDMTEAQTYRNGVTRARVQPPINFETLFGRE